MFISGFNVEMSENIGVCTIYTSSYSVKTHRMTVSQKNWVKFENVDYLIYISPIDSVTTRVGQPGEPAQ